MDAHLVISVSIDVFHIPQGRFEVSFMDILNHFLNTVCPVWIDAKVNEYIVTILLQISTYVYIEKFRIYISPLWSAESSHYTVLHSFCKAE